MDRYAKAHLFQAWYIFKEEGGLDKEFEMQRETRVLLKPGFHMSGKSQTIGDFTFCRPSQILPIYRIIARGLSQILPIMN